MKAFYVLMLLVFLASCGTPSTPSEPSVPEAPISDSSEIEEEVAVELDEEAEKIIEELISVGEDEESSDEKMEAKPEEKTPEVTEKDEEVMEKKEEKLMEENSTQQTSELDEQAAAPKVVELATTYNNPAGEVDMNISYSLDSEGKITQISVTSDNYKGMGQFNTGAQGVVGMTVKEASEYYISGSSLSSPAFQKALKGSL